MNIQIYFLKKNFDVQKAMRYFKERSISFQLVDLGKRNISMGELNTLISSIGFSELINKSAKAYSRLNLEYYGVSEQTKKYLLEYPELLNLPIVRNNRQATVGYNPQLWSGWV